MNRNAELSAPSRQWVRGGFENGLEPRGDVLGAKKLGFDPSHEERFAQILPVEVVVLIDTFHVFDHIVERIEVIAVDERPLVEVASDDRVAPVDGNDVRDQAIDQSPVHAPDRDRRSLSADAFRSGITSLV